MLSMYNTRMQYQYHIGAQLKSHVKEVWIPHVRTGTKVHFAVFAVQVTLNSLKPARDAHQRNGLLVSCR